MLWNCHLDGAVSTLFLCWRFTGFWISALPLGFFKEKHTSSWTVLDTTHAPWTQLPLSILHTFPSLLFILSTFSRKPLFPLLTVTFPLVFLPLHLGLCHVLCWVVVFHTQNLSFLRWYMIHDLNVCCCCCFFLLCTFTQGAGNLEYQETFFFKQKHLYGYSKHIWGSY